MPPNASTGYEDGVAQHSLRDLLTIIFKHRSLILVILLTVVTIVMLITLLMPRTYEVTATFLVNEARAEMQIAPTDSTQLIVNRVSEEVLNSEIEVLKSRKLIEDIVRRLVAEEPLNPDSSSSGVGRLISAVSLGDDEKQRPEFNELVLRLQGNLDISAIRKSNVLQVSYVSTDPVWATRVVGALSDEYLRQRAERYRSPQAAVFFEQQMKDAEQRLRQREQALEEFVDQASITMVEGSDGSDSLAAQKGLAMERLAGLESSLGNAEVELESQRRQVASLLAMLQREPERLESSSRDNLDAATEEIERALASLRLQRDALLQDFKPESRHVRDIDTQIKMAEDRLVQSRSELGVSGTESNPVFLQIKGELVLSEAALEGTHARVSSLRTQVVEYRKVLDTLNDKAFDLESLHRDSQVAEEDYLLYRKKHEEARISAAMDQEKFINVTVAQPAQMPLKAEPRGLALKLFLSIFLGLLGGVGLAFGLDTFLDRSFTTAENLERRLGIPHIASIPEGEMVG